MAIQFEDGCAVLSGRCELTEVEELMDFLERTPDCRVSLDGCEHMHAAIYQLLYHYSRPTDGTPASDFVTRFILPALQCAAASRVAL